MSSQLSRGPRNYCGPLGFSLLEMVVVLAILVALGGIAVRMASPAKDDAHRQATQASLLVIRDAVIQYWSDTKHVALDGIKTMALEEERFQLRWLFHNPLNDPVNPADPTARTATYPDTRIGWNGPYLMSASGVYSANLLKNFTLLYGDDGHPAVLDAYASATDPDFAQGHPIVVQVNPLLHLLDVRIVSAGPNGVIDIPPNTPTELLMDSDLRDGLIGDDLYVAFTLR